MHRIERHILSSLIRNPNLRYSELKPTDVEGNLFMYHLKRTMEDGLVEKSEDGSYTLTSQGKLLADKLHLETLEVHQQPRIVLLMAVLDDKKGWLLHRRTVQPLINMVGFLHANVKLDESIAETAQRRLKEVAGLEAEFAYQGSGLITMYSDGGVESYVNFHLLRADNPEGELIEEADLGENYWATDPGFEQEDVMPSMVELSELLEKDEPFFVELTYNL